MNKEFDEMKAYLVEILDENDKLREKLHKLEKENSDMKKEIVKFCDVIFDKYIVSYWRNKKWIKKMIQHSG